MTKSDSIGNLAKALAIVQSQLQPAEKDSANPFFKSKYSSLNSVWEACRELLSANGLVIVQTNEPSDNGVIVETVLMHESNEWISGSIFLPLAKHDAQGVGSAISYGRRYGLAAMIGIVSDDDDGDAASQPRQQSNPKPAPPTAGKDLPMATRIRNIEKAIKELGVKDAPVLIGGRSDSDLSEEFETLKEQYKRLKARGEVIK